MQGVKKGKVRGAYNKIKSVPQHLINIGSNDFDDLVKRSHDILKREIDSLEEESMEKKLCANSAKDLVSYIKLFTDIEDRMMNFLSTLGDDDLKKLLRKKGRSIANPPPLSDTRTKQTKVVKEKPVS